MSSDYVFKICFADWFIHALALSVITPLLLVWRHPPTIVTEDIKIYGLEATIVLLGLIGLGGLILNSTNNLHLILLCLMLPLSVWATIRFEQHGASFTAVVMTIILLDDKLAYFYGKQTIQFTVGDIFVAALLTAITTLTLLMLATFWSEQRQLQRGLIREKHLAINTLHSIADAVITTDKHGDITYLNPVAAELTGWTAQQSLGKNALEVFQIKSLDSANEALQHPIELCLQGIISPPQQCLLVNRERCEKVIRASAAPISHAGAVEGTIVVFHDISKEHNLREQLTHQACHDALTGLYNRREFEFRLNTLINTAKLPHNHILYYT
ncbi:MAG: PAS domain-containing protein [Thiotrichaceae bacterium]